MPTPFRPSAIVPTYDNPRTIRRVVERLREHLADVIVVDDGSGPDARGVIDDLARDGLARVVRLASNRGKGSAVKAGFTEAQRLGFTHALQIDADEQHDLNDVPTFLDAARTDPTALVLGFPVFDRSVPWGRLAGRQLTIFCTRLETGGRQIVDPMCGFRVYPLAAVAGLRLGGRMDFDIETAVKLVWLRTRVINLPTKVRYLPVSDGGVSHFRMFEDNLRITWLHTRLICAGLLRLLARPLNLLRGSARPTPFR